MLKGSHHTEATKRKNRRAHLGKHHSDYTKLLIAWQSLGRNVGPKSEKHKAKLRAVNLGKKHSEATKAKMRVSQAKRGPRSEETKRKISVAALGKPKSEATRKAMSKAWEHRTPRRLSEAEKLAISARMKDQQWTKERRAKISGRNSCHWGKTPKHWLKRVEYNGTKFRSTWEVRCAKALDRRGIRWGYEPKRFDLGDCSYLPDFYLPRTDSFLEVKGWFGASSQRKCALFREKYPEYPLVVVTKRVLTMMEKE